MTLLSGGCGGGEEILGVYLVKKNPFFSVGKLSILINVFVYGCCLVFFDIETVFVNKKVLQKGSKKVSTFNTQ